MLLTFGHSTYEWDDAMDILKKEDVDVLVDVRSHPGSTRNPQWNREGLEQYFEIESEIKYKWIPNLGGWSEHLDPALSAEETAYFQQQGVNVGAYLKKFFPKQQIGVKAKFEVEQEPAWTNQGLRDYSYFMMTPAFFRGIDQLFEVANLCGRKECDDLNIAFMCVEVLWWKCHRSMIADYLVYKGHDVYHLTPQFKRHNDVIGNRLERYEPPIKQAWEDHFG